MIWWHDRTNHSESQAPSSSSSPRKTVWRLAVRCGKRLFPIGSALNVQIAWPGDILKHSFRVFSSVCNDQNEVQWFERTQGSPCNPWRWLSEGRLEPAPHRVLNSDQVWSCLISAVTDKSSDVARMQKRKIRLGEVMKYTAVPSTAGRSCQVGWLPQNCHNNSTRCVSVKYDTGTRSTARSSHGLRIHPWAFCACAYLALKHSVVKDDAEIL